MKRLIDANKIEYENIYVYPTDNANYKECVGKSAKIREAETVLTIPDNPTNGDMIKTLFPNSEKHNGENGIYLFILKSYEGNLKSGFTLWFPEDWWNAPYKRGEEE